MDTTTETPMADGPAVERGEPTFDGATMQALATLLFNAGSVSGLLGPEALDRVAANVKRTVGRVILIMAYHPEWLAGVAQHERETLVGGAPEGVTREEADRAGSDMTAVAVAGVEKQLAAHMRRHEHDEHDEHCEAENAAVAKELHELLAPIVAFMM